MALSFEEWKKRNETQSNGAQDEAWRDAPQRIEGSTRLSFEGWKQEEWERADRSREYAMQRQQAMQQMAIAPINGAIAGISGMIDAVERARNTYIPAQFGQRILDRQRQQEYAMGST